MGFDFYVDLFCNFFSVRFFQFCFSAFELSSLKTHRKRDKTIQIEENLTLKFPSVFGMYFFVNIFCGVFELPLPSNIQNRTKKNATNKKVDRRMVGSRF
jgi:hypothetical protein